MTDHEWLREFGETGSEEAFARIVGVYAPVVYATARRQVGHAQMAEDVTQAVFIILAKRAKRVARERTLGGWLIRTTYFAAAHAQRAEGRRQKHERRAAAMRTDAERGAVVVEMDEALRAAVDRALARLPKGYRDVIVLRYWESKTFEEVSAAVGIGEATARKRLERGLKKMRGMLGRGGVELSTQRLEGALAMPQMGVVPAGLVAGLTAQALAGAKGALVVGGGVGSGVAISKGAMIMMTWTKVKVAAVAGVIAILLAGGGAVVVLEMAKPKEVAVAAPAEGGVAGEAVRRSGPRGDGRTRAVPAALASPLRVKVVDKRGKPLEGAWVEAFEDNGAEVKRDIMDPIARQRGTESDGITAPMPNLPWPRVALYAKAAGYAPAVKKVAVGSEPVIVVMEMEEANVLSGKVVNKEGAPVAGAVVSVFRWRNTTGILDEHLITDEEGNFRWENAPADEVMVDVLIAVYADKRRVTLKAGAENNITLVERTRVIGSVLDAATGEAVEKFKVVFGDISGTGAAVRTFWLPEQENRGMKAAMIEGGFEARLNNQEKMQVRVTAEGYAPADSPVYAMEGQTERYTFKLQKAPAMVGTLVDEGGKGVQGVRVYIVRAAEHLQIQNGEVQDQLGRGPAEVESDAAGHFSVPPQGEAYLLMALGEGGIGWVDQARFEKEKRLVLEKWGRLEGEVRDGTKAASGVEVTVAYSNQLGAGGAGPRIYMDSKTNADAEGRYFIERVRPGKLRMMKRVVTKSTTGESISGAEYSEYVTVKPGETVHLQVGGMGRDLVWRVELPAEWNEAEVVQRQGVLKKIDERQATGRPVEATEMTTAEYRKWLESDVAKKWVAEWSDIESPPSYFFVAGSDGEFRARSIPNGKYELQLNASRQAKGPDNQVVTEGVSYVRDVEVKEIVGGGGDEVLDLGTMALKKRVERMKVGDSAAEVTFATLDGKAMALGDLKGKYVLVNLWHNSHDELPEREVLGGLWEEYGKSGRLAMVGIYMYPRPADARAYVAARPMAWKQGILEFGAAGTKSSGKLRPLPGGKSAAVLIDPEGKVVAMDLRGEALRSVVEKVMGK